MGQAAAGQVGHGVDNWLQAEQELCLLPLQN